MKKLIFTLIICALCAISCDSRKCMSGFEPQILVDNEGNKYFVEHHIGDTYSVTPLNNRRGNK